MSTWSEIKKELYTLRDTEYGKLSGRALGSIKNNNIETYVPLDGEKEAWEKFKKERARKLTYGSGTIDLTKRPVVKAPDGGWATVLSMSFQDLDGKETLIPLVIKNADGTGRIVSEEEAKQHYRETGEYLGKFDTVAEAEKYAEELHNAQNEQYKSEISLAAYRDDPVFAKYGIDPFTFDKAAMDKWAEEHNFVYVPQEETYFSKREGDLWNISGLGGRDLASDEDKAEVYKLQVLSRQNERRNKASALDTGSMAFLSSASLGAVPVLMDAAEGGLSDKAGYNDYVLPDRFIKYSDYLNKAREDEPGAAFAGDVAGSLIPLTGVGGLVAKGTKAAMPWLAKAPQWIRGAINSGITFGIIGGAQTGIAGGTPEEIVKSAGISALGGAFGGSVSGIAGRLGEKFLFNKGLQNKIIPEMVRSGIANAAFAGGHTLPTYALYPEGQKPSAQQIATDLATAFAYGMIQSGIGTLKTSSANRAYLRGLTEKMQSDYGRFANALAASKGDTAAVRKIGEGIIKYSEMADDFIAKNRFVGQDKYVKGMREGIATIRNNVNAGINGMGTPETGMTAAGTSGAAAPALTAQKTGGAAVVSTPSGGAARTAKPAGEAGLAAAEAGTKGTALTAAQRPKTGGTAAVTAPPVQEDAAAVNKPPESEFDGITAADISDLKPGDVLSPKSNNNKITVVETNGTTAKIEVDNGTAKTERVVPAAAIKKDIAAGKVEKTSAPTVVPAETAEMITPVPAEAETTAQTQTQTAAPAEARTQTVVPAETETAAGAITPAAQAAADAPAQAATPAPAETAAKKPGRFTKGVFQISARERGTLDTRGLIYHGVGIHKEKHGGYTLTHIKSGKRFDAADTLAAARAKARYYADRLDMTVEESEAFVRAVGALRGELEGNPALYLPGQADKAAAKAAGEAAALTEQAGADGAGESAAQRNKRLTETYITPEINAAIEEMLSLPETIQDGSPARVQYREDKAEEYYRLYNAKNKDRQAYLILGLPSAGKSAIAEPLAKQTGSMILDSDIIKTGDKDTGFEGIPEYRGGSGSNAVHEESGRIAEMVLNKAAEAGDNLVYPKVGGKAESILKIAEQLKEHDYTVNLILNELPLEKAFARNILRYKRTGRLVNPRYLLSLDEKPTEVYNEIKGRKVFDHYERYSNDVGIGQEPILRESSSQPPLLRLRRGGGQGIRVGREAQSQQPQTASDTRASAQKAGTGTDTQPEGTGTGAARPEGPGTGAAQTGGTGTVAAQTGGTGTNDTQTAGAGAGTGAQVKPSSETGGGFSVPEGEGAAKAPGQKKSLSTPTVEQATVNTPEASSGTALKKEERVSTPVTSRGNSQSGSTSSADSISANGEDVNSAKIVLPGNTTKGEAIKTLMSLAGKPLKNDATGIVAYINSTQRAKMISGAAFNKSVENGFTGREHLSAAANIAKLWKSAVLSEKQLDKNNDANIKAIKRFTVPVTFALEGGKYDNGQVKITVKESVLNGHRIYSLEIEQIEAPPGQSGKPFSYTTPGASANDIMRSNDENVNSILPEKQGNNTKNSIERGGGDNAAARIFTAPQAALERFSKQVDAWESAKTQHRLLSNSASRTPEIVQRLKDLQGKMGEQMSLGNTPYVLRALGAADLPMVIDAETTQKAVGGTDLAHNIALDEIKRLPSELADPIMVFDSDTVPGSFVVLTALEDANGHEVVAAIRLKRRENRFLVNSIASVHTRTDTTTGKNLIRQFIETQAEKGNLRYIDKNKSRQWTTSKGLQLPKLVQSLADSKNSILTKEDVVNRYYAQNENKYKLEAEGKENERGLHSYGNGGREARETAAAGSEGVGKRAKGDSGGERHIPDQRVRGLQAQDVKAAGRVKRRVIGGIGIEAIERGGDTPEMRELRGFIEERFAGEVVLFAGKAMSSAGKPLRGFLADGKILAVRYDSAVSPYQTALHELAHSRRDSANFKKVVKIARNSLSVTERRNIAREYYALYYKVTGGNEGLIFEEFICDVLAGLSEYSEQFDAPAKAFWDGGEIDPAVFTPAEYSGSIDAGGFADSLGFGEVTEDAADGGSAAAFSITKGADNKPVVTISEDILKGAPKKQWISAAVANLKRKFPMGVIVNQQQIDIDAQSRKEITHSNYSQYLRENKNALFADKLRMTNNADEILIATVNWINEAPKHTRNDNIVNFAKGQVNLRVLGNDYTADVLVAIAKNGKAKLYDILDITPAAHKTKNPPRTLTSQKETVVENAEGSSIDSVTRDGETVNSILPENTKKILYSIDREMEAVTRERVEEIRKQYDKDRPGVVRPSFKEQWGERAGWVARNISRVFADIPERGEEGIFFAEFRKLMIQWKALPKTASFLVQDSLHKMTAELSPKEFKTFGELVYFLDLQEEAKIQLEKGYDAVLLPNEITPREVDELVRILKEEATDKVQAALKKRRGIWKELKKQYIALNQALGFHVEGRFERENYYRHQVIQYMTKDKDKGAGRRNLGISAGRGWLKERRGSTLAVNTDFLAVEYQAMLQMRYDTLIAKTLVSMTEQYDIKPRLMEEAYASNRAAINEMIAEEARKRADTDGAPLSGTEERQNDFNQRIARGFDTLMTAAEEGRLPDFGGGYSGVIRALERRDPGGVSQTKLRRYAGELANMELADGAAEGQTQTRNAARDILKYLEQKKDWVKETLGGKYQTWKDLVDEKHTVFQPRKGHYFYTKEAVDDDAFQAALSEIMGELASGAGFETDGYAAQLFQRYSGVIRAMGQSYKQFVLPKVMVKTMDSAANPAQANLALQTARTITAAWKGWSTVFNLLRTVKYGVRNLLGDLDAVIAGKPQILRYAKRAMAEIYDAMKNKNYSPAFMEWVERGGYSSILYVNDMDMEMRDKLFAHLKEKRGKGIFEIPKKIFAGYAGGVEAAHNFREAILRYAAYLYFKDTVGKNGVTDYVASSRFIVQGLKSVEDKAYQLSKDLLGAYDEVGRLGQVLRRYATPFYSFTETNARRYYRMFANILASDASIPKKAGRLLLKILMANLLLLLCLAWNRLVMRDDEAKLPPSVRARPHITLGSIGDSVYAFTRPGAFSELLEWVGLDDWKLEKDDLLAPVDKAWGMITPFVKLPVELASGVNFYPEVTKPRAIRDRLEHFFDSWGLGGVYNLAALKPTRGVKSLITSAVVYQYDYEESAYYEILDRKREFQNDEGGDIYRPDDKANALYYMKAAIRLGDKKAAIKYMNLYFENGGTGRGLLQSFRTLDPMYGFTSAANLEKGTLFVKSLSVIEKQKLKTAQSYYETALALPESVAGQLKKKDLTDAEARKILTRYIMGAAK